MTITEQEVALMKTLARCKNARARRRMVEAGGASFQKAMREVCYNLLRGNMPLSRPRLNKLRPYRKVIRDLSAKRTSLKRRVRLNLRGGFLAALLPAAIPAVLSALSALLGRR